MNPRFEEHQILEPGEVVLDVRLCSSFPCLCQFRLHAYFQKPLMSLRFISTFSWRSFALCFVRMHQEVLLRSCVDVILFKYVSCNQFKKASLTLSQPRGGHIVPPPPPPRYTFSNISRTPLATDLKLSDVLNEQIFQTKNYFSTASAHPWLTLKHPKLMNVFEKHISAVFMRKFTRTRRFFFAISMKSVPNAVCCGNLGLTFRLIASWWHISFFTLFRASSTLN